MAMLAEPRRRKRYNLCPRGKALYEDDNRFGTKMLEKMGWSKGRGLGPKEDGEQEFVRVRFKNDAEGLGYEARDDQWTTHEEGFNGLLQSLNGGSNDTSNQAKESESEEEARPMGFGFKAAEPEEPTKKKLKENISGVSLEEKSKQSKARVHYKKFTRGKDLSQYSEKDLANIFGKKATDAIEPLGQIEQLKDKEDVEVNPNFSGVQTVSTGLSVSDYFKQKMDAMKNKLKNGDANASTLVNGHNEAETNTNGEPKVEEEASEEPRKKKKKNKNKERTAETPYVEEEPVEPPSKKKKKSKRFSGENTEKSETSCVQEEKTAEGEETNPPKRKKKKDKQEKAQDLIENFEVIDEPAPKKKKKNKKSELNSEVITIEDESSKESLDTNVSRKNKSSKIEVVLEKIKNGDEIVEDEQTELLEETSTKKKKKLKKAKKEKESIEVIQSPIPEVAEKPSKKKKKSMTSTEIVPEDHALELEPAPVVTEEAIFKKFKDTGGKHRDAVSAVIERSGDKSNQSDDKDQPNDLLSLDEIKERLKSFNTCTISQFCADKFQVFEMSAFQNSTLGEIVGYGSSENVELNVVDMPSDERRILDLWKNKSNMEFRKMERKSLLHPKAVKRSTIRAVKKRVAFQGI
ncbi:hypothetical protein KR009_011662 [Drosophila setifemur]|nr:hypothetical protein KR009_011662 [Drosophila setifemur]